MINDPGYTTAPFRVAIREDEKSVRILIARNETMEDAIAAVIINRNVAYLSEEVHIAIVNLGEAIGVGLAHTILGLMPDRVVLVTPPEEQSPDSPKPH